MKKTLIFPAIFAVAVFGSAALLSGCCGDKIEQASPAATLTGATWKLELKSLPAANAEWQKPEKDITLEIRDNRVSGCAGVNNYFGTAKYDEAAGKVRFSQMGCTMMAGPGLEYETAFLKQLATVDSYKIDDDDLELYSLGQKVAEFDLAPAAPTDAEQK